MAMFSWFWREKNAGNDCTRLSELKRLAPQMFILLVLSKFMLLVINIYPASVGICFWLWGMSVFGEIYALGCRICLCL